MLVYKRTVSTEPEAGAVLYLPDSDQRTIRHGYLLREDQMPEVNAAPDTLTLNDTWYDSAYPGVYLFFPSLPNGTNARKDFVTGVSHYLKHADRVRVRFAWFLDSEKWQAGPAPLDTDIRVIGAPEEATTDEQMNFAAKDYSLRITKGNRIYLDADRNLFVFESAAFSNSFGDDKRTGIKTGLELVLNNEPQQGCFRFALEMDGKQLDALNVSLDYFYQAWVRGRPRLGKLGHSVFDTKDQNLNWPLQAVFDPLDPFSEGTLQDSGSPLHFDDLRTGFAFATTDGLSTMVALKTHFRTRYGKQIELTPVKAVVESLDSGTKPALLTFNRTFPGMKSLSVVLQGDFHLGVIDDHPSDVSESHHFLCGLSGTETISFRAASETYAGDIMRFHPRKPAYSSRFPLIGETREKAAAPNDLLEDRLTTSWVSIHPHAGDIHSRENFYYSQPQDSPLFQPGNGGASTPSGNRDDVVFDVFDAPSANLAHSDIQTDCFPLVPVAAAPVTLGRRGGSVRVEFETQIINPTRKTTIDRYTTRARPLLAQAQPNDPDPANLELTTTPQGFLVAFDKTDVSRKWQSLVLANEQGTADPPLEMKRLPPHVQSAFQTNEQFLVISNPDRETLDYLKSEFRDRINIASWPFKLDVAGEVTDSNTTTRYRNILIFKFCRHSLVARLQKPELWTQPEGFNRASQLDDLSQWILEYIDRSRRDRELLAQAQQGAQTRHDKSIVGQGYDEFLHKVEDPNWNGIMALQVTLPLDQLPQDIQGIAAGIDQRRFAAHHVAINSNQILRKNGQLDADFKSSMFGLISYVDRDLQRQRKEPAPEDAALPRVSGDYGFKVLELQVLFKHSEIADFNCKVQLSINSLFDEPVSAEVNEQEIAASAVNRFSIVLEGLYDRHDGETSYSFRQLGRKRLELNSVAVREVTIQSVHMSTLDNKRPAQNSATPNDAGQGMVTTRFALSGYIATHALEDLDMLSYDRIGFSALHINMAFNPGDAQGSKRFRFLPDDILLDPRQGKLRDRSLVKHFPITLQSLRHYSADTASDGAPPVTPSTLGFQKVEAPMNYNAIGDSWYALQFNLNLGSMGSLAAREGFEATLLLSWSPGIRSKAAQIWIQTPFSGGGGKQFSVQGVLKLVTQSIRLEKKPDTGRPDDKPEYAMLFTNVKVSLLGLKLPPSGNTLLYLFGNPDAVSTGEVSGTGNLGWFGAYKKTGEKPKKSKTTTGRLPGPS